MKLPPPADWSDDDFKRWLTRGLTEHYSNPNGSLQGFEPYDYLLRPATRDRLTDLLVAFYNDRLPRRAQERFRTALMRVGLEMPATPAAEAEPMMQLIIEMGRRLPAPEICRVIESRLMSFGGLSEATWLVLEALPTLLANCKVDRVDLLLLRFLELPAAQPSLHVSVVFRALVAVHPTRLDQLAHEFADRIRNLPVVRRAYMWRDVEKIVGEKTFDAFLKRHDDENWTRIPHIHLDLAELGGKFSEPASELVNHADVSHQLKAHLQVLAPVYERESDEQYTD